MKSNLTIILFLKDRHEFNKRFINYFLEKSQNINLIISDGGKKKLSGDIRKSLRKFNRIKYIKFPEDKSYILYYQKIFKSLKFVKTKFVLFADNDDFLVYENIIQCLKFLANKGEYIGAGGTMIGFNMLKKKNRDFKLSNLSIIYNQINLDQNNKIDRFNNFIKNFSDLPRNCIIKKDVLIKNYSQASKLFKNNVELKDHFSALFNIIHGKIKILNKPMIMHQTHLNSEGGSRFDTILKNFSNKNFIKDLILFDNVLSKKLKCKKNFILENYFENVISNIFQHLSFRREPSTKELYNLFLIKLKRRMLKDKNQKLYLEKNSNNHTIEKIVKEIEFFLKKKKLKKVNEN